MRFVQGLLEKMFCLKAVRAEVGEKMIYFRVRINSSQGFDKEFMSNKKETNAPKTGSKDFK